VALVLLLVAGYFGGAGINAVKAWQARRHAANAFAYINKQNWTDARKEATAAYQLRPTNRSRSARWRDSCHARASRMRSNSGGSLKDRPVDPRDRQDEAAVAIMAGETMRAETAVNTLLRIERCRSRELAARPRKLSIQKGVADERDVGIEKTSPTPRNRTTTIAGRVAELSFGSGTAGPDDAQPTPGRESKTFQGQERDCARCTRSPRGPGIVDIVLNHSTAQRLNWRKSYRSGSLPIRSRARAEITFPRLGRPRDPSPARRAHCRGNRAMERLNSETCSRWRRGERKPNSRKKKRGNDSVREALLSREFFYNTSMRSAGRPLERDQNNCSRASVYPLRSGRATHVSGACNAQLGEKTAPKITAARAGIAAAMSVN